MTPDPNPWPALPLGPWRETRDALHLWTQIVGKTLLALCPPQNHWWHAALRVSSRGLASPAPAGDGDRALDLELDLVDHLLHVRTRGRSTAMRRRWLRPSTRLAGPLSPWMCRADLTERRVRPRGRWCRRPQR